MSLILEALKKSEAERQLGRAPGLTTPMPVRRRASEPRWTRWLPWVLAGTAALLVALSWLRSGTSNAPAVPTHERSAAVASAAMPAGSAVPSSQPVARDRMAATGTAAAVDAVAPPAIDVPHDARFDSVERESAPVAVAPPTAPAPSAPSVPRPAAASPAEPPTISRPAPAPPSAAAAASVGDVATPAAADAPAKEEALPRLDHLGGPQREGLPPLKQTMHVFAEDPAGRFVLIDGERLREGDRLGPALTLVAIRRDGTVFELGGIHYLLPRP